jgi:hypothetical protein
MTCVNGTTAIRRKTIRQTTIRQTTISQIIIIRQSVERQSNVTIRRKTIRRRTICRTLQSIERYDPSKTSYYTHTYINPDDDLHEIQFYIFTVVENVLNS